MTPPGVQVASHEAVARVAVLGNRRVDQIADVVPAFAVVRDIGEQGGGEGHLRCSGRRVEADGIDGSDFSQIEGDEHTGLDVEQPAHGTLVGPETRLSRLPEAAVGQVGRVTSGRQAVVGLERIGRPLSQEQVRPGQRLDSAVRPQAGREDDHDEDGSGTWYWTSARTGAGQTRADHRNSSGSEPMRRT